MNLPPLDPNELDRPVGDLQRTSDALERYASAVSDLPAIDLVDRIHAAITAQPPPRRDWWAIPLAGSAGHWGAGVRAAVAVVVVTAAVVAALLAGQLAGVLRNVGNTPPPAITTPSPSPTETPEPSDEDEPTPSAMDAAERAGGDDASHGYRAGLGTS